jgi:hypothetical protein
MDKYLGQTKQYSAHSQRDETTIVNSAANTKMEAFAICYRIRKSFFYIDGIRMPNYSITFQRNHYHFAQYPLRLTICYRKKDSFFFSDKMGFAKVLHSLSNVTTTILHFLH